MSTLRLTLLTQDCGGEDWRTKTEEQVNTSFNASQARGIPFSDFAAMALECICSDLESRGARPEDRTVYWDIQRQTALIPGSVELSRG